MTIDNESTHYNQTPTLEQTLALTDEQINAKLQTALNTLLSGTDLTYSQMREVMLLIFNGKCSDVLMSGLLVALRSKNNGQGESVDEITAAAAVMRELSTKVYPTKTDYLVDIVGTGGDGSNLFNVSTASAMVASAAGARVAKHGNRSVSSKSGSSDLLDKAGIRLDLTPEQTTACIDEQGLGFLFAPNHHPAIRYAMPVRKGLGVRTIFNVLGPLTNPAGVPNAVIGVFDSKLCEPLAQVLKQLGDNHIMVVGSDDRLDEISLATATQVAELKDGVVTTYTLMPEDVGIERQSLDGLQVASSDDSLALIRKALSGQQTTDNTDNTLAKARDMIALNAGAAIYVSGRAYNLANGVSMAQTILQTGGGLEKLESFAKFTQEIS